MTDNFSVTRCSLSSGQVEKLRPFFSDHSRGWRDNRYVYPVISRRAGGLSIGVNLNPDKACNFDCVYCQVDRGVPPVTREVDVALLAEELERTVDAALGGELFTDPHFAGVPAEARRINDIAFSGDGEPTTCPRFVEAIGLAADLRRRRGLDAVKLVLITDAAYLDRPKVREGLAILDDNNGEIWAKLDAGTEEYYRLINRPNVPLRKILDNILGAARIRPIVIQSLWMKVHGRPPPETEVEAFAGRLRDILADGGRLRLIQVYTIARRTAEPWVAPLTEDDLTRVADRVRAAVNVPVAVFGG
jgi:wyosine [tRNA(Phe)-imidazoG37] synthetase (radical SAM superfamily)